MTDDQLKAAKGGALYHIPCGGVVPTYNIEIKDRSNSHLTPCRYFLVDIAMERRKTGR
jgi:hypothetical protein